MANRRQVPVGDRTYMQSPDGAIKSVFAHAVSRFELKGWKKVPTRQAEKIKNEES